MTVNIPDRNQDQVKITGAQLGEVMETRENMDGGLTKAEHATVDTARVHDHGISARDHVGQSAQRAIRQDVKKPGGSPGLVSPDMANKAGGIVATGQPTPEPITPPVATTQPPVPPTTVPPTTVPPIVTTVPPIPTTTVPEIMTTTYPLPPTTTVP